MNLSTPSFKAVVRLFHSISGIELSDAKRPLVASRLQKLAQDTGAPSLDHFVEQLLRERNPQDIVRVVDKLTTNETYFFREPKHFEFLEQVLARRGPSQEPFRVWSAASSTGEEAYSIAMVLADKLGTAAWEIVGTDLSTEVVDKARRGLYPMSRAEHTPPAYLKRFCLRGQDQYEGHLLIKSELRQRVSFQGANLTEKLPEIGLFDVIFLRNVLIYFDPAGKEAIVQRVIQRLKPHGYLFTGHAESLSHLRSGLRAVRTAVYALT
ncbi:CheR family methyltransferase [Ideonella livida]|uniref:Chemotaxis protein methyltransferase n=1 Tax=Ideonella livida TaxID=2707176 RepID=A0A7C9PGP6_9BURK|nr:CheR family methyltransferase [Ideonella livida]NDY91453.1 SAM-dependent methyltransferase [Ideonella livida]